MWLIIIVCKTEDGGEFIVEMQNKSQLYFSDKMRAYTLELAGYRRHAKLE